MGRRVAVQAGASLWELARAAGVELEAACGGKGLCGRCRVKVNGEASAPTEAEREVLGASLEQGLRLACQAQLPRGGVVWVPEESRRQRQVILTEGLEKDLPWDPAVRLAGLELEPSRAGGAAALEEQVKAQLDAQAGGEGSLDWRLPPESARLLGDERAGSGGRWSALWRYDGQVLELAPGRPGPCLGLAVDLAPPPWRPISWICSPAGSWRWRRP